MYLREVGAGPEVLPLTGVRGLAALWVLLFHAERHGLWRALPGLAAFRPVPQSTGLGYLAVDLLFLLSGFILTWNYADAFRVVSRRGWQQYILARVARIYPIHLAVLVLLGVTVAGGAAGWWASPWSGPWFRGREFLLHLGLVHSWGYGAWLSWNQPAWSISAEWFAYLWFPFVCAPLTRLRPGLVLALAAAVALAGVMLFAPLLAPRPTLNAPHLTGLVRVTGEFLAGCCLCRAFLAWRDRRVPWAGLSAAALVGIVVLAGAGRADPWALPLFGVLVTSLAASKGPVAAALSTRVAVLGGRISYALYMVHWPVFGVLALTLGDAPSSSAPLPARLGWAAVFLATPIAVAWVAWRWIEEPARRAIHARVARVRTDP